MRLRNKKTGEICELGHIRQYWREEKDGGMGYCLITSMADGGGQFIYNSLAEMMEEWEDYAPKEPLIKDDDAKDAVRSWASSLQIHQVSCKIKTRGLGVEVTTFQACSLHSAPIIEFASLDANVVNGGFYTIAELCGTPEPLEPTFVNLNERIKEKEG